MHGLKFFAIIGTTFLLYTTVVGPAFGVSVPQESSVHSQTSHDIDLYFALQNPPASPDQARPAARPNQQTPERVAPQRRARPTVVRPGGRPEGIGRPQGARPQRVRPIRRPAPQ